MEACSLQARWARDDDVSLRTRLLLAFAVVVVIPIALLAVGLRQEMVRRLTQEYETRLAAMVEVIRDDLQLEGAAIDGRLALLARAIQNDNGFRRAAVAGVGSEQSYLLDYAGTAMGLTGLSMLQIQDGDDRVISSGHFRNEHGRVEAGLAGALAGPPEDIALVTARTAEGGFLALARTESFRVGAAAFTLVGGIAVDEAFLARLARDPERARNPEIVVSLEHAGGGVSSRRAADADGALQGDEAGEAAVNELPLRVIRSGAGTVAEVVPARLLVTQSLAPLRTLQRNVDAWFVFTLASAGAIALLLAVWVSSRISRPLAALAEKTAVLDLDRLDVEFDAGTDEVGMLSRLLGDLAARLRTSSARIREAERRATVGDLARQITHDIKNGLIPLRNVMRHLAQVQRDDPGAVAAVLAERRQTVDSSIAYLETLATNYERLSRPADRRACDLNELVSDVVRGAREQEHVDLRTRLAGNLPRVGDPVALRRILENLIANAVDSLDSKPGGVTVSTELGQRHGEPSMIWLTVADTGRGMSIEESGRIFTDFYTTKEGGTGLGLSIVRRLVMDLQGTIRVESGPGAGTRMVVELPAGWE